MGNILGWVSIGEGVSMQSATLILGLIIAAGIACFFLIGLLLMERRWKRLFHEVKTDVSSQPMWILMQQQMKQLRGHLSDGLNRNISLLTEQFRAINEQVGHQLQLVNQQFQNSSGHIDQRLDTTRQVIGEVREKLGELSNTSEQIHEVGKNIATLQKILRPPKLRGGLLSGGLSISGKTYQQRDE
jgi:methyl-accepting chemotaxis protein